MTLTPEKIAEINDYWTLPPVVRDERYGKWPLRNARDDIRALCEHIASRDTHCPACDDHPAEPCPGVAR